MSGVVVWFTGLPASGKTTLARRVREHLHQPSVLLDSDELREVLGLRGYTEGERNAFYAALGRLAALLARQELVVLVAATAPRQAHREAARLLAPRFVEVWVRATEAECAERDVKGLYARARAGDAPTLPGPGAAYDPPPAADVIVDGGLSSGAVEAVLARLAH